MNLKLALKAMNLLISMTLVLYGITPVAEVSAAVEAPAVSFEEPMQQEQRLSEAQEQVHEVPRRRHLRRDNMIDHLMANGGLTVEEDEHSGREEEEQALGRGQRGRSFSENREGFRALWNQFMEWMSNHHREDDREEVEQIANERIDEVDEEAELEARREAEEAAAEEAARQEAEAARMAAEEEAAREAAEAEAEEAARSAERAAALNFEIINVQHADHNPGITVEFDSYDSETGILKIKPVYSEEAQAALDEARANPDHGVQVSVTLYEEYVHKTWVARRHTITDEEYQRRAALGEDMDQYVLSVHRIWTTSRPGISGSYSMESQHNGMTFAKYEREGGIIEIDAAVLESGKKYMLTAGGIISKGSGEMYEEVYATVHSSNRAPSSSIGDPSRWLRFDTLSTEEGAAERSLEEANELVRQRLRMLERSIEGIPAEEHRSAIQDSNVKAIEAEIAVLRAQLSTLEGDHAISEELALSAVVVDEVTGNAADQSLPAEETELILEDASDKNSQPNSDENSDRLELGIFAIEAPEVFPTVKQPILEDPNHKEDELKKKERFDDESTREPSELVMMGNTVTITAVTVDEGKPSLTPQDELLREHLEARILEDENAGNIADHQALKAEELSIELTKPAEENMDQPIEVVESEQFIGEVEYEHIFHSLKSTNYPWGSNSGNYDDPFVILIRNQWMMDIMFQNLGPLNVPQLPEGKMAVVYADQKYAHRYYDANITGIHVNNEGVLIAEVERSTPGDDPVIASLMHSTSPIRPLDLVFVDAQKVENTQGLDFNITEKVSYVPLGQPENPATLDHVSLQPSEEGLGVKIAGLIEPVNFPRDRYTFKLRAEERKEDGSLGAIHERIPQVQDDSSLFVDIQLEPGKFYDFRLILIDSYTPSSYRGIQVLRKDVSTVNDVITVTESTASVTETTHNIIEASAHIHTQGPSRDADITDYWQPSMEDLNRSRETITAAIWMAYKYYDGFHFMRSDRDIRDAQILEMSECVPNGNAGACEVTFTMTAPPTSRYYTRVREDGTEDKVLMWDSSEDDQTWTGTLTGFYDGLKWIADIEHVPGPDRATIEIVNGVEQAIYHSVTATAKSEDHAVIKALENMVGRSYVNSHRVKITGENEIVIEGVRTATKGYETTVVYQFAVTENSDGSFSAEVSEIERFSQDEIRANGIVFEAIREINLSHVELVSPTDIPRVVPRISISDDLPQPVGQTALEMLKGVARVNGMDHRHTAISAEAQVLNCERRNADLGGACESQTVRVTFEYDMSQHIGLRDIRTVVMDINLGYIGYVVYPASIEIISDVTTTENTRETVVAQYLI